MARRDCTCAYCGSSFVGTRKASKYCSAKCKLSGWRADNNGRQAAYWAARKAAEPCKVSSGYCIRCGKPYCKKGKTSYCSDSCNRESHNERMRVAARDKYAELHCIKRSCKRCGVEFVPEYTGGRMSLYCGDGCRDVALTESKKRYRKIRKARRRALEKDADAERIDPFAVFARDGWKCKLCGTKTPQAQRGTLSDNAPELDHIIPLSKGGKHTYTNVQCACRKCNGMKIDKPLGQLLLIG